MVHRSKNDSTPTLELIRRAQSGDLAAYDRVFEEYYGRVLSLVRRRLGARLRFSHDSVDILQEAMVQAIRSFDRFEARDEHALLAWFARIVENRIRNAAEYQSAAKRDRRNEVVLDHLRTSGVTRGIERELADDRTLPFEALARKERSRIVAECLEEIPDRRRQVVLMRNQEHQSWEDIGRALGCSPSAARMLYSRALVELKQKVLRRLGS